MMVAVLQGHIPAAAMALSRLSSVVVAKPKKIRSKCALQDEPILRAQRAGTSPEMRPRLPREPAEQPCICSYNVGEHWRASAT